MDDKQILDYKIGETTINDMGSIAFMGWVASKLNGQPAYKGVIVELSLMVRQVPLGSMAPEQKIEIVRKMLTAGIEL